MKGWKLHQVNHLLRSQNHAGTYNSVFGGQVLFLMPIRVRALNAIGYYEKLCKYEKL